MHEKKIKRVLHFVPNLTFTFISTCLIQVWFQNARAKFRRMVSKQEGKSFDSEDFDSFSSPVKMLSGGTSPASID